MPRALLLVALAVVLAPSPLLGQEGLIGTWRLRSHTIEIRGDGTAVVDGATVQYTVRGTTLTFSGREGDRSYAFAVGRDTLRLESGGMVDTYKRVVPAAAPPTPEPAPSPPARGPDAAPPTSEPDAAPPTSEPDAAPPTREPDAAPPTREPDATRQPPALTPAADQPRSSGFESPVSGPVLATATIGPGGGTLEAPGAISVELPPGALARDMELTLKQGSGGIEGGTTWFIEGPADAHVELGQPATVRIPLPAGTSPEGLAVFQQIDDATAFGFKPTFDAASGSLVFTVNHFSWLSWGSLQKWAKYAGGWTVVILIASGGGWTVGTFAITFAFGMAHGTVHAPLLDNLAQRYGLDCQATSQHFSVLYAQTGDYATPCARPWIVVRRGGQWSHTSATSIAEAKKWYPDVDEVASINSDVNDLLREFETVHQYYQKAGYEPPDHTWASVFPGLNVCGEWDSGAPGAPGFMRIDSAYVSSNQSKERRLTLSHEYFHAICEHHGWDGIAPCTEESVTLTYESAIFPACDGPHTYYGWAEAMKYLENGLARGGPGETDATGEAVDSVKRGYRLWPFGKFLLHRMGGHEDVRKYMTGALDGEMLAVTFKLFARALFNEDGLPEAEADARPLVAADASFMVPTGWGGYSADSNVSDQPMPWGEANPRDSFGALRPLSFAMRRLDLKLPRSFGQEEVPLLVVRRKVPMSIEEYLFKGDGGDVISARQSLVLTGKELLVGGGDALVGRLGIYNVSRNAYDDPLLVYLLASPVIELTLPPSGEPPPFPLYEIEPLEIQGASGGVNPEGLAAGYRAILREPPKEGETEGALVESEVLLPLDQKTFDVRDVAGDLSPASVAVVGICAEDRLLKDGGGKPLRSNPFMIDEAQVQSLEIRGDVGGKGVIGAEYKFAAVGTLIPASASYTWDFGDEGHATGEQVAHGYKREGTYTITLTARWDAAEVSRQKRIEIAPDVAEAKAEANFYVFRWRKNKMGKSKQACQIIHVAILNKEGQVIDGGHADAHNGLFSIVLPVGHYGYKVDYQYTNPPHSGSASGAFDVREGDRNWTDVETPSSEAFEK